VGENAAGADVEQLGVAPASASAAAAGLAVGLAVWLLQRPKHLPGAALLWLLLQRAWSALLQLAFLVMVLRGGTAAPPAVAAAAAAAAPGMGSWCEASGATDQLEALALHGRTCLPLLLLLQVLMLVRTLVLLVVALVV
jgi:hypothetical protein